MTGASNFSTATDEIALTLLIISCGLVLSVVSAIVYFSVKYRAGSSANRKGAYSQAQWPELAAMGAIFLFGLATFVVAAAQFYKMYDAPADATDIYVSGKQWMWTFQVSGGPREIGHVKVPLGKPVRLLLDSEDVIHSFFVPEFRVKQDAVPGRYTSLWFTATKLGEFAVLCSEFCGTSHSAMRAVIEVVPPKEFEEYRHQSGIFAKPEGRRLYRMYNCGACHDSGGKLAPELAGLFGREVTLENGSVILADENYLRRSITEPNHDVVKGYRAGMPTYKGVLRDEDLTALVDYLKNWKQP